MALLNTQFYSSKHIMCPVADYYIVCASDVCAGLIQRIVEDHSRKQNKPITPASSNLSQQSFFSRKPIDPPDSVGQTHPPPPAAYAA
jgi:hypothetical protein